MRLGRYELRNRMVMAPLTRNRAGAGDVPHALNAEYYRQRAGAGLIVTEASPVSPQAIGYPSTPGIFSQAQIEGCIVCNEDGWLTPLRFDDEPVRHKLIDLLGDLSLTGVRWKAHFLAYKASHTLHGRFARQLIELADKS